jgi:hypothetical protein
MKTLKCAWCENQDSDDWLEAIRLDESGLQKMFLQYDQQFRRIGTGLVKTYNNRPEEDKFRIQTVRTKLLEMEDRGFSLRQSGNIRHYGTRTFH